MSTRGAYGFRKDDTDKVTYNHSDSYPTWLGVNVIQFIQKTPVEDMVTMFDKITLVAEDAVPTDEQKVLCAKALDLNVSGKTDDEWYCLLRGSQGDLSALSSIPFMTDGSSFLNDSLFCEFAYILNLDSNELEIYSGFNKSFDAVGRYASGTVNKDDDYDKYYGVKLIRTVSFDDLKDVDAPAYCATLEDHANAEIGD